ncbi:MAG: flagellar biosynthetic protein FliO [Burkholderiales bacterium]
MSTGAMGFDWFRYIGSMALVLALLLGLLWLLRRLKGMQRVQQSGSRLQLLETISIGPRQKISLLRVGSKEVLVGITAGQFTALGHWDDTPAAPESDLVA